MPSISAEAQKTIQSALEDATKEGTGIPGIVFCAVDKGGNYLTESASGTKVLGGKQPVDLDTVFWIASCTKMITGIACMQLHEQGKLDLDSSDWLYKVCPELKDKKVLQDDGKLVPKEKEITVRMLLAHTAGFGYTFFDPKLRDYARPTGYDEFTGDKRDYVDQPLVNQPGSAWEYGINIDWAGIAVERTSGMSLNDYFQKHIFEPLGIKNINFFPTQHMRENLITSSQRAKDGSSEPSDHPFRRPIWLADQKEKEAMLHSGGAGCFAKPKEYCQILATLLNDGQSPTTGNRILEAKTVDEMFKNQIPEFPNFARNPIPASKPAWTNPLPELYPQEGNPPQGWGLTFMTTIEPGPTGRGANTGWWAGIVNLFWWCDREKGVAGMIASQILPFGDPTVLGTWINCEKAVYDGLKS